MVDISSPFDNGMWSQLLGSDIGANIEASALQRQQQAVLQAQQQRAAQQQAQLDEARAAFAKDPSAQNFSTLVTYDPKSYEAIKSAHDAMDTEQRNNSIKEQTAIHGYLAAGRPREAAALLDRRIAADKAAGLDTADDQEFRDLIDEDPAAAAATVAYHLGSAVGADKFGDVFGKVGDGVRADAELPGKIAATNASTAKTVAEANQVAPNAAADRDLKAAQVAKMAADVDTAAARLGLDRERLNFDIDAKTRELDLKENDLPDAARSLVNQSIISGAGSRQLATKSRDLADRLIQAGAKGGFGAGLASALTGVTGDASAITQMRREYAQLRGQQAIKNLPPGGQVSNKDMETAMKGLPPENASGETIASFLRGVADMQDVVAAYEDRKADWLVGNRGSLGAARKGFFVGNTFVAPGTRFDDVEAGIRKEQAKAAAAARVAK